MELLPDRLPAQAGLMTKLMWFVYMLKSQAKEWYYVGSTNDTERRLFEHNSLKVKSTKHYAPFNLVFVKEFDVEKAARDYERKIKDCRKEKERIVREIKSH